MWNYATSSFNYTATRFLVVRRTGIIAIFIGLISFGIDLGVFTYLSNYQPGSWWAALFVVIVGILALYEKNNRYFAVATSALSSIFVFLAFIGFVVDAISSTFIGSLEACVGPSPGNLVGYNIYSKSGGFTAGAVECFASKYAVSHRDCYCVTSNSTCFEFSGQKDCFNILGPYHHMLVAAAVFDLFALIAIFYVCCASCAAVVSPRDNNPQIVYVSHPWGTPSYGGGYNYHQRPQQGMPEFPSGPVQIYSPDDDTHSAVVVNPLVPTVYSANYYEGSSSHPLSSPTIVVPALAPEPASASTPAVQYGVC